MMGWVICEWAAFSGFTPFCPVLFYYIQVRYCQSDIGKTGSFSADNFSPSAPVSTTSVPPGIGSLRARTSSPVNKYPPVCGGSLNQTENC
jgi:hypothetical protein